jgi:hypothetical protein
MRIADVLRIEHRLLRALLEAMSCWLGWEYKTHRYSGKAGKY